MKDKDGLTPLQREFRDAYLSMPIPSAGGAYLLIRPNATRSCADREGFRLLRNPKVSTSCQVEMDKRAERVKITSDQVLKNIIDIGHRCMQRWPVMVGQGKDRKQLVEHVETEDGDEVLAQVFQFDSGGALKAQELLGKHLKLFTEKTELSGPDGGPVTLNILPVKPK